MRPEALHDAYVLTGPTASGKTAVGVRLAERLGGEIISMDSMALYRGMNVGTAKPTAAERARVGHHLVDVREPWQPASVAWWLAEAGEAAAAIRGRGRQVLVVGGTALYLKALAHGLFEGAPIDAELRARLEATPLPELYARLQTVDPPAAARLHANDKKRIVRALEVYEQTGTPMSAHQRQFAQPAAWRRPPVWLDLPRAALYRRIEARIDAMMSHGLLHEVRDLGNLPLPLSREARQALGYKELLDHLAGKCSLSEAVARIKTRSRNFAKRQLSWFRNWPGMVRVPLEEGEDPEAVANRVTAVWS
jgi:tRNA dimethylallyltransferase